MNTMPLIGHDYITMLHDSIIRNKDRKFASVYKHDFEHFLEKVALDEVAIWVDGICESHRWVKGLASALYYACGLCPVYRFYD
jgi:hypothetical protein